MVAFGVFMVAGLSLGWIIGATGAHRIRNEESSQSVERVTEVAEALDRSLDERYRALRLMAKLPAVLEETPDAKTTFAAFKKVYPEFSRIEVTTPRPATSTTPPSKGGHALRLTVEMANGKRLSGKMRSGWPTLLLGDPSFGTDPTGRPTALITSGGPHTTETPTPPTWSETRLQNEEVPIVLPWGDGRKYLTAVRKLRRTLKSGGGFAIVTGIPVSQLDAATAVEKRNGLILGMILGLIPGSIAWTSIGRSTRRLRATNEALERRVTERTAELESAERSFRGIFENAPFGLYQCDPNGCFLRVNPTFALNLGFAKPEDLIAGLGSLQALGDSSSRAQFMATLRREGEVEAITAVDGADGRRVWFSERARATFNAEGEVELIEGAVHDITGQRELENQLRKVGATDPLTGLLNRRGLQEAIDMAQTPVSFVVLDVDRFKAFNDSFGHLAGDEALKTVAEAMRKTVGEEVSLARTGGEEFVVLLPQTDADEASRIAEVLREAISDCEVSGTTLTVSGGVATGTSVDGIDEAFAKADRALYQAKEAGRNRIVANLANLA